MNTTRATPIYYRVTGLWGALEGSLLLWEWILVIFAAVVAWQYRARERELLPWVLFVFSGVSVFFLAVMSFASNPFEAIDHFKNALEAEPNNPTALSYLGIVLWRRGHEDAALETVERALRAAPGHPLALWAKGLILYEAKGDYAGAIQSWEALLRHPLAQDDADTVARTLAEARRQLTPHRADSAAKAASSTRAADHRRRIAGTVTLADGLRRNAPVDGTLFVIARRGTGPPLAVKRIVDPKFPAPFTLGPEDVMVHGTEFAGAVTLVARLKRDGRAGTAVRGDLEGVAPGSVTVGTMDAQITLQAVR